MLARPLGRSIHVALAVPTAACVVPAIFVESLGGMGTDFVFVVLTAGAGVAAAVSVVVTVVRWCLRRPPFHGHAVGGSPFETVLAAITGLCLGGYVGAMHETEVLGLHFSAAVGFFALLPLALLVCCARRPAWRPFLDVTLLMTGVEIGAQVGMSITKWKELRWWDDVTGIDLAYWAGGVVAAVIWLFVQRRGVTFEEEIRIRVAVESGDLPPPNRA